MAPRSARLVYLHPISHTFASSFAPRMLFAAISAFPRETQIISRSSLSPFVYNTVARMSNLVVSLALERSPLLDRELYRNEREEEEKNILFVEIPQRLCRIIPPRSDVFDVSTMMMAGRRGRESRAACTSAAPDGKINRIILPNCSFVPSFHPSFILFFSFLLKGRTRRPPPSPPLLPLSSVAQ